MYFKRDFLFFEKISFLNFWNFWKKFFRVFASSRAFWAVASNYLHSEPCVWTAIFRKLKCPIGHTTRCVRDTCDARTHACHAHNVRVRFSRPPKQNGPSSRLAQAKQRGAKITFWSILGFSKSLLLSSTNFKKVQNPKNVKNVKTAPIYFHVFAFLHPRISAFFSCFFRVFQISIV